MGERFVIRQARETLEKQSREIQRNIDKANEKKSQAAIKEILEKDVRQEAFLSKNYIETYKRSSDFVKNILDGKAPTYAEVAKSAIQR